MLRCHKCEEPISSTRIKAFLNIGKMPDTCQDCSDVGVPVGHLMYTGKTGGEICIVDSKDKESVRQLNRVYRRAR